MHFRALFQLYTLRYFDEVVNKLESILDTAQHNKSTLVNNFLQSSKSHVEWRTSRDVVVDAEKLKLISLELVRRAHQNKFFSPLSFSLRELVIK